MNHLIEKCSKFIRLYETRVTIVGPYSILVVTNRKKIEAAGKRSGTLGMLEGSQGVRKE